MTILKNVWYRKEHACSIQCAIRIEPTVKQFLYVSCKVTNDYKHHDRKLFKSNGMQINVQYINGFMRNSTSSVSWTKTPCSQY